jgi:hypothetical protein
VKPGYVLYQLGTLGLVATIGVFWEEPIANALRENSASWDIVSILYRYGFAVLAGFLMSSLPPNWFTKENRMLMYFSHGAAFLSILWLLLWCFVWLAMMSAMGDKAEMMIKHTAYLHLFGVGFSMAGYATGWMSPTLGERSGRFLMTVAWAVSYMAWFNLYLQPTLQWLWAPAIGGLLAVFGAYWMSRPAKPSVETPA